MPDPETRPSRRPRLLMVLVLAALLAVVIYFTVGFRSAPVLGDPAALRAASEELVTVPRRVLVVAAHPDDAEWYVGGTILRMTAAGSHVTLLIATDGERGRGRDQHSDLASVRRAEQAEAARRLGCAEVILPGLPDMALRPDDRLIPLVREAWERVNPEVVFTFDAAYPQLPYIHPDHQAIGHATAAVFDSLEGARPALYLFHTRRPDTVVDITATAAGKSHALGAHRSQGFRGGVPSFMLQRASIAGKAIGAMYGEEFRKRQ